MIRHRQPLLARCAELVEQLEPCTVDAMLPHLPGYSRLQVKRATENAAYRDLVKFMTEGPMTGKWVSAATARRLERQALSRADEEDDVDLVSTALRRRTTLEYWWLGVEEAVPQAQPA